MNEPRPRAHVTIRAQEPALRARILKRLTGLDGVEVEVDEPAPPGESAAGGETASITPRELEVLQLMADGLANKEIAARLGFSTHTAKFHVESLLRKLDAVNRAEAVREGIRRGFIGL